MSKIYFHPDIDYQEIKNIEKEYNSRDKDYLINKVSDAIYIKLQSLFKRTDKILFVCGPGYNGLDGIITSHKLLMKQYNVSILLTKTNIHLEYINKFNLNNFIIDNYDQNNEYQFIVDGIFGYGLNRNLNEYYINLINLINQSSSTIISLDVPSGLNPITGKLMPVSIKSNLVISLLTMKKGLFTNEGRDTWKEISNCAFINDEIISENYLITANDKFNNIASNKFKDFHNKEFHNTHKKSNGINCILAGQKPFHGAMILATSAAIKSGSKYLQVITEAEYAHTLPMIIPEIIAKSFSLPDFIDKMPSFKNLLIGPGTDTIGAEFVKAALDNINLFNSIIIDAGSLMYIDKKKSYSNKLIITPHPGEAAKILNITASEVQADRFKAARKLHDIFKCLVILKGSGSIIFNGDNFYTCMDGNYKMGIAGMGDILSGILLTEVSLCNNNLEACIKSVVFHSYASDILYQESKNKNITPTLVLDKYSELTHHDN